MYTPEATSCTRLLLSSLLSCESTVCGELLLANPLPPDLQSKVIYKVPCSCGKAYIGETTRRLETRLKEHKDACIKQVTDKSAIAEHAWNSHCPIKWEEASVLDHARNSPDLMIKEAIHIQTTPMDRLINRDKGAEIPGCWVATINALAQKRL